MDRSDEGSGGNFIGIKVIKVSKFRMPILPKMPYYGHEDFGTYICTPQKQIEFVAHFSFLAV